MISIDYLNEDCQGCHSKCKYYRTYCGNTIMPLKTLSKRKREEYKRFMDNCPCSTCLVKMICYRTCDQFYNYSIENNPSRLRIINK